VHVDDAGRLFCTLHSTLSTTQNVVVPFKSSRVGNAMVSASISSNPEVRTS